MINNIDITHFLELAAEFPVIDVRSPVEFQKGHIPGSFNISLFTDDERAQIGTTYKQIGTEEAVKLGESIATPKIPHYLKKIEEITKNKEVLVLCFRGGMRSRRFSQLLVEHDYHVHRLDLGYKSYRTLVQDSFKRDYPLCIVGGKTGSGKTEILIELAGAGEQIIDLEGLSNHRGSAFGSIGMERQPTTEHFENLLFTLSNGLDFSKRIWIEDESLNIGRVYIPGDFYAQMKKAPLVVLKMDKKFRVQRLCRDYSSEGKIPLIEGIQRIGKRLGGERVQKAISALEEDNFHEAASIILDYYDKCYSYGLTKKTNSHIEYITMENDDPRYMAGQLLKVIP